MRGLRIAYFDCFSGISGDMVLAALIDAGLDVNDLKKELQRIGLKNYEIKAKKTEKNHIACTEVKIKFKEKETSRNLDNINDLIEKSSLDSKVKEQSKKVFMRLAKVEAKVHNKKISEIRFHEGGAIDSILDTVGSVIGVKQLGIEKIYCSKLRLGSGFVRCAHGMLPVPSPATAELIKGLPVYSSSVEKELVTPTGAAIITTLAKEFGGMPLMKVEKVGYGAGKAELEHPNLLRVFIGETTEAYEYDSVKLIETNIDDMNPQVYDYVIEKLLKAGALDVYLTPIYMKKNRPATKLSILADINILNEVTQIIFDETTTLGVRISEVKRKKLSKETVKVKTKYGEIKVKIGKSGKTIKNIAPEYEECKKAAIRYSVPLKNVYREAKKGAERLVKG